ncbi:MAG TPA: hypothetical protein DC054_16805 [Blastocatellia bacterium]|nr:hypothetical protein [Blastocatellia bacterium]
MVDLAEPKSFEIGLLALRDLRWSGFATDGFTFRISINGKLTASRLCIIRSLGQHPDWRDHGGRLRSVSDEKVPRLFIQPRRRNANRA